MLTKNKEQMSIHRGRMVRVCSGQRWWLLRRRLASRDVAVVAWLHTCPSVLQLPWPDMELSRRLYDQIDAMDFPRYVCKHIHITNVNPRYTSSREFDVFVYLAAATSIASVGVLHPRGHLRVLQQCLLSYFVLKNNKWCYYFGIKNFIIICML